MTSLSRYSVVGALIVAFAACLVPQAARAQAPNITSQGDPSIASDTIYKLAVDSIAYPEQGFVLLLDDGVVVIQKDGSARRTFRQVVQILRDRSSRAYQQRQFTFEPDRQHFTLNWLRVLKPTGEVISSAPAHTQESDLPASMVNPVYVHRKVVQMSLSGVAPGTLVDMSWTYDETSPYRVGDFFQKWRVTAGTTIRRSRFVVDVPKEMVPNITELNLSFPRREEVAGNRKVYTWWTQDVAWIKPEMYAPPADSTDLSMSVAVATPATWSDIGSWYAKLASDRLRADPRLRDTVKSLVAHASTFDDSLRAIHRWVAQDIRYVSLSLGIGGYLPRWADTVMATGFGDCKDKSTLFVAALGAIGVDAYPVLLRAGGQPDRALPTIAAFNHEIAAIKHGPDYEFVDLTSDLSPLGTLPYPDAGAFALVVHPNGHTDEVTTPPDPPGANRTDGTLTGTLTSDGVFTGRLEVRATGLVGMALRAAMRNRMDSTQRAAFMRNFAASIFPDAKGDSLITFDGKDLRAEPKVSLIIRNGQATQSSGETDILSLASPGARYARLADELEAQGPRKLPVDAAKVAGPTVETTEVRITLPTGWHARLPSGVAAKSVFGTYESTYQQDGRDLIITHRTSGTTGIFPKSTAPELIAWFRAIAKDRASFIVIEHAASSAAPSTSQTSSLRSLMGHHT